MPRGNRKSKIGSVVAGNTFDGIGNDVAGAGDNGNSDGGISEAVTATVDPETVTAGDAGGETDIQPKRRGRPRGSGNASKAKTLPLNVNGLEKLLVGIHGGLAMLSGRMEWSIDTESKVFDGATEAEFLAKSIKDVADHYGAGMFDQKTLDWANLIQCLMIVYGGRIFAIRSTPKAPRTPRQPNVQEATSVFNPMPQRASQTNGGAGVVDIAGVGSVEFSDDDPRSPNYKPRFN